MILVTGGSGFIGTELVKYLKRFYPRIKVADLREPKVEVDYIYCDITDPYQVEDAIQGSTVVFHLAANPNPGLAEKNPRWDFRINVEGTMNVIDSCIRQRARMIFTSTAAIKYSPLSCYAISKRTAEQYILHAVKKHDLNASIVRLWNVYGPTQPLGLVIPDFIKKLQENPNRIKIRGTGFDLRDFIYIKDVVRALEVVMKGGEQGQIYEIGTGQQYTIKELAETIGRVLNNKVPIVVPSRKVKVWNRNEIEQNLEPIRSLGWKPKYSLEEGLRECIRRKRK